MNQAQMLDDELKSGKLVIDGGSGEDANGIIHTTQEKFDALRNLMLRADIRGVILDVKNYKDSNGITHLTKEDFKKADEMATMIDNGLASADDFDPKTLEYKPKKHQSLAFFHPIDDARDFASGIIKGANNFAKFVQETSKKLNYLQGGKGYQFYNPANTQKFVENLANKVGSNRAGMVPKFFEGAGEYVPYGEGIAGKMTANLAERLLKDFSAGYASGAINTDGNRNESGAISGVLNALIPASIRGTGALVKQIGGKIGFIQPTSNLPEEELRTNVEAAKGTNTPLGKILNNQKLMELYKDYVLPYSTNAREIAQSTHQKIKNLADNLIANISGEAPDDMLLTSSKISQESVKNMAQKDAEEAVKQILGSDDIDSVFSRGDKSAKDILQYYFGVSDISNLDENAQNALKARFKDVSKTSKQLYNALDEQANLVNENLSLITPSFAKAYSQVQDELTDNPLLSKNKKRQSLMAKVVQNDPKQAIKEKEIVTLDPYGFPVKQKIKVREDISLKDIRELKNELYNMKAEAKDSNDATLRRTAGIFGKLATAIDNDYKGIIENSGDAELIKRYQLANEHYKANYVPFIDHTPIFKYVLGSSRDNPDRLLAGLYKSDEPTLAKIANTLLGSSAGIGQLSMFKDAFDQYGNVSAQKLAKLVKNRLSKPNPEAFIPNPEARTALTIQSELADTLGFLSKFMNDNGEINLNAMQKAIEGAYSRGNEYAKIVKNEASGDAVRRFMIANTTANALAKVTRGQGGAIGLQSLVNAIEKTPDIYNNLSPSQLAYVNKLKGLMALNPATENPDLSFPTGIQNKNIVTKLLTTVLGAKLGGALGAYAINSASKGKAEILKRILTDEKAREKAVEKIIAERNKPSGYKSPKALQIALQSIINSQQGS